MHDLVIIIKYYTFFLNFVDWMVFFSFDGIEYIQLLTWNKSTQHYSTTITILVLKFKAVKYTLEY